MLRAIDELRQLVNMANWTNESAFDGLDLFQVIRLLQACAKLDLETLPDQLTKEERLFAATSGFVPRAALHRLYESEGLAKTGRDWKE